MKRIKHENVMECVKTLRKALSENYDDYNAACYQMKGIVKNLLKKYDADTITMAFESASKDLLESKPNRSKLFAKKALGEAMKALKESAQIPVNSEEELKDYLSMGVTVFAASTGAFGEDEGAEVIYFGDIGTPKAKKKIWVDDEELSEFEYESVEDYCDDFAGTKVIILNDTIGQSDNNFYMLDARDVADCELYVDEDSLNESKKKAKKPMKEAYGYGDFNVVYKDENCVWMDPEEISEPEHALAKFVQDYIGLDNSQVDYGECTIGFRGLSEAQMEDVVHILLSDEEDVGIPNLSRGRVLVFRHR